MLRCSSARGQQTVQAAPPRSSSFEQVCEGRSRIGLSGDTGVCPAPMVQWRVYVNGTAVDPRLLDRSIE